MPWKYVYDPELTREVRKLVKDMDLTTLAAIEALPDVGDVLIATMEKRHTTVPLVIKCPRWRYPQKVCKRSGGVPSL